SRLSHFYSFHLHIPNPTLLPTTTLFRSILDVFAAFGPPTATTRPVPVGYVARATADHPPGFYGPPEGLLAVNTLAPADRLVGLEDRKSTRLNFSHVEVSYGVFCLE